MDFALGMTVRRPPVLYALADRLHALHEHASTRTRTRNIYCGMNTGGFLSLAWP